MQEQKQIGQQQWSEYLSQVTADNRGRRVSLDVVGQSPESAKTTGRLAPVVVDLGNAPFLSLEYDPVNKGNAIIVSAGENEVSYEHPVENPVQLTANLGPDGRLDSLEILDQNGVRTKLNFF
jgi:hypothetical protein